MKTLLLMRHGKSSWKDSDLSDHDRPLKKRGVKNSARMGELLKEAELIPQRILSSTAVRSRQTVEAIAEKMDYKGEILYLDTFYLAEMAVYLAALQTQPDDIERVMIVGHNPGLESLMQVLSRQVEALTTAAVAYIILPVKSWRELTEKTEGELHEIWRPRELN